MANTMRMIAITTTNYIQLTTNILSEKIQVKMCALTWQKHHLQAHKRQFDPSARFNGFGRREVVGAGAEEVVVGGGNLEMEKMDIMNDTVGFNDRIQRINNTKPSN